MDRKQDEEYQRSPAPACQEPWLLPSPNKGIGTALESSGVPWYVRLWASVIRRAVVDWVLYRNHEKAKLRSVGKEAEQWLFSDEEEPLNSFISVCGYLNLDPELVRRKLRSLSEEDARRLRGMEFGDEW